MVLKGNAEATSVFKNYIARKLGKEIKDFTTIKVSAYKLDTLANELILKHIDFMKVNIEEV